MVPDSEFIRGVSVGWIITQEVYSETVEFLSVNIQSLDVLSNIYQIMISEKQHSALGLGY